MGNNLLSLKGPEGRWHGQTTLSPVDSGQRRMLKLRNGYVNHDGSEIRQWPGSFTLLDLSENQENGYSGYTTDAVLPIYSTSPTEVYQFENSVPISAGSLLTLRARAKAAFLHGFEQVQDQVVIFGESRFVEIPIFSSARVALTITQIENSGGVIRLTLSGSIGAVTTTDAAGAGMNGTGLPPGLTADSVLYIEDVTLTSPAAGEQAAVDAKLNKRVHQVGAISSPTIDLQTTSLSPLGAARACTGKVHIVAFNRANTYDNTNGLSPYDADPTLRIDDPTSLTSWRVIAKLAPGACEKPCYPAWVANRQRDFGDKRPPGAAEGIHQNVGGTRGVSRREKLELPYRVNPECAVDRIILAAPAYGCMFQIPVKVPADPTQAAGIGYYSNDVHDKPRALGIPKARMIDSAATVAPTTPTENLVAGFDFRLWVSATGVLSTTGLPAGEYQFAVSWEDDALGEEGLASEVIAVTVPSLANHAYTVALPFMHPGYVMPECLALKMNVYIATPGADDLAFYASFPLQSLPVSATTVNNTNPDLSAKYGFLGQQPTAPFALYRNFRLPLPATTDDLTTILDPERLAPQSASMPRGSDACRYVRGVLLSGGNLGNTGGALQVWAGKASATHGQTEFPRADEIQIRVHGTTAQVPIASMDGDLTNNTLGVAGRAFPSAYQGISFIQQDLLPAGRSTHQIDRLLNRLTTSLSTTHEYLTHQERLQLVREAFARTRTVGTTPTTATNIEKQEKEIFYLEPKGQLQVGDPGAPFRASPLFIKFVDPNRGDDTAAIGNLGGTAIVCSQRETYSFAWNRNPGAEEAQTLSNQFGCIAANSMVEFDGGLAWMSARGPVAIGQGLQHIGHEIEGDFMPSPEQRYSFDGRGMMRHCWGAHDEQRGLILWGLVTTTATQTLDYEFVTKTWDSASDELRSRFPCDEVLIWSYRTNSFSTWRPPAGREILWMRPIRDQVGETWMCYLAADGRIYALEDRANDTTRSDDIEFELQTKSGAATTTLAWTSSAGPTTGKDGDADTKRDSGVFLRTGQVVEFCNPLGQLYATRTITAIGSTGATTSVTLSATVQWDAGDIVRVGTRQRMTIITTFLGRETKDNLKTTGVQLRYTLAGDGTANCKASLYTTDKENAGPAAKEVHLSDDGLWGNLGIVQLGQTTADVDGYRNAHRKIENKGGSAAPETAVKLEFTGTAQVRLADILLEVA
jgi:hypothetical protein